MRLNRVFCFVRNRDPEAVVWLEVRPAKSHSIILFGVWYRIRLARAFWVSNGVLGSAPGNQKSSTGVVENIPIHSFST